MTSEHTSPPFPRGPLLGAAALILLALAAAGAGRLAGVSEVPTDGVVVAAHEFRFEDRADGAVVVRDAASGGQIDVVAPGTNGFLRATLRGLARQRRMEDQGPGGNAALPFRLTRWADGRLTLTDLATGRAVELESFGVTNEGVFAGLLTLAEPQPVKVASP